MSELHLVLNQEELHCSHLTKSDFEKIFKMFALSCSSVYIWFSCSNGGIVDLMFGDMKVLRVDHQPLAVSDFDFSFSASFSLNKFLESRIMIITSLRKFLNFAQRSFKFVF